MTYPSLSRKRVLEVEVCDGEAEAMYDGELPSPIPRWVIGGLLRCRDHIVEDRYHSIAFDEETGEEWEATVVGRSDHGDYIYHVRLC